MMTVMGRSMNSAFARTMSNIPVLLDFLASVALECSRVDQISDHRVKYPSLHDHKTRCAEII